MATIQAMERAERQRLIISHKNESRVMASALHEVSARLAYQYESVSETNW